MKSIDHQLAKAKVNLALHVTSKRSDGFHNLDSLVCFPQVGDRIICRKSSVPKLFISGKFREDLSATNNIITRVLREISSSNRTVSVHLEKNIPVSAGLGGGSADAAAVIRAFTNLWEGSRVGEKDILAFGADVPVCMESTFQHMQGIGEKVKRIRSKLNFHLLLVNSGDPISTKEVFQNLIANRNPKLEKFSNFYHLRDLVSYLKRQRNDLEQAAFSFNSNLEFTKCYLEGIKGCLLARLSGSGGTVFGIFEKKVEAFEAYRRIKKEKKSWWVFCAPVNLADPGCNITT